MQKWSTLVFSVLSVSVKSYIYLLSGFHLEKKKKVWLGEGECLEITQHKVPCDFLVGVAHSTLLVSEHQASSGAWLKLY